MKSLSQTKQFARDVRRMCKQDKDLNKLRQLVQKLANRETLDPAHRDHPIHGEWKGSRDCHIESDWVLIYTMGDASLRLERTGAQVDLFE